MASKHANDVVHSTFSRFFDPVFLVTRKDMTPLMMQTARGQTEQVIRYITDPEDSHEAEMFETNGDGNDCLLLAVGNQHVELATCLLELKADPSRRNSVDMNAFEYAILDGLRTPIAKAVISSCTYVIPEIVQGPFMVKSLEHLAALKKGGELVVTTSLIGPVPDLLKPTIKDAEMVYTTTWLKDLVFLASTVQKGIMLLCSEVGYLERDANMVGILDVPRSRRYVYLGDDGGQVVKYNEAMKDEWIYRAALPERMFEACSSGELAPVVGLLKASASADVQDILGESVLMRAGQHGDLAITRCLLHARATVDTQSKDGFSALLLAASAGHAEVVRTLLRARADPQAKSRKGYTVLAFVKHQGHKEVLKAFEDVHNKAKDGNSVAAVRAKYAAPKKSSWNPFTW